MSDDKVIQSDCLHCVIGQIVEMVGKAGETPDRIIGHLMQVTAEFIESARPEDRAGQKAFALKTFEQCGADARKAFDNGMAANQPVAGNA